MSLPEMMPVKHGSKPPKAEPKATKPDAKAVKSLPIAGSSRARVERIDDDLDFAELSDDFQVAESTLPPGDARPNPLELPAPINPEGGRKQSVEMHRNLFCLHYDECLDEAVKRGWNSFTCIRCAFYHTNREEKAGGVERFATQRRLS